MKNISKVIIIVFFFFLINSSVLAANASPAASQVRKAKENQIQEQSATKAAELAQQRRNIIRRHFRRMMDRFHAVLNRFEILVARIESRIKKIENKNQKINVSSAEASLEEIKANIRKTRNETIPQAEATFKTMNTGQKPGEILPELRKDIKELKEEIIAIHQSLVKLIKGVKSL